MTIEERAVQCCMTCFPLHETADAESMKQGYIKGATEQRKIDIDKACEVYRKELTEIITLFNKIGKDLYDIDALGEVISLEGCIKDFSKKMEDKK